MQMGLIFVNLRPNGNLTLGGRGVVDICDDASAHGHERRRNSGHTFGKTLCPADGRLLISRAAPGADGLGLSCMAPETVRRDHQRHEVGGRTILIRQQFRDPRLRVELANIMARRGYTATPVPAPP